MYFLKNCVGTRGAIATFYNFIVIKNFNLTGHNCDRFFLYRA